MKNHEQKSYTCDIILLGLQGAGKSFLVKQVQSYLNGEDITKNYFDLIPTFGVNLDHLKFPSKMKAATRKSPATDKCRNILVREVGGGLLLGWNKYIDDCKMIIYMVDMSNHAQLAASSIELLNLLSALRKEHKPFLILLNKIDAPSCIQVDDFKRMIRWNDLVRFCSTEDSTCNHMQIHLKLKILTMSAFTGRGIDDLIQYIEVNLLNQ
jgi:GTPase SAR1 family protein